MSSKHQVASSSLAGHAILERVRIFIIYMIMEVRLVKMTNCKFCGKQFASRSMGGHTKYCELNPEREEHLQKLQHSRLSITNESRQKQIESLKHAWKRGLYEESIELRKWQPGHKHTEATKAKLSASRKSWLTSNPDKHPWKNDSKFYSEPCQKLKDALTRSGLEFFAEFNPLQDRFYAVDIAFPAIKVGIEVNGEQHYNRDGSLKTYYQVRHDLIEASGWKLYEIHYSLCYNEEKIKSIIESLIETHDLRNIDLKFVIQERQECAPKTAEEITRAISEATKGTIWIHKDKALKRIPPNEIQEYLSDGWSLGKLEPIDRSHNRRLTNRKFSSRQEYADSQKLTKEDLQIWKDVIDSIDTSKFGFIGKISKKMDCSHTHVRRVLKKYFPEVQAFTRKTPLK